MKTSVIRQPLSSALVLFSVLAALFWGRHLLVPLPVETTVVNPMPLGAFVAAITRTNEWVEAAVSLIFTYLTAVSLTRLISRNLVFQVRTHSFLPLMAIAGFGVAVCDANSAVAVAMFLLSRGSEYFASAFKRTARAGDLFGGGLMLGLAPLFHAPAVVFLVLIPCAMPVYLRGVREAALAVAGGLLPAFACSYVNWAVGRPFGQLWTDMKGHILTSTPLPSVADMGWLRLTVVVLLAGCVIMGAGSFAVSARKIRTRAYRIHLYMFYMLACAVGMLALPCSGVVDLPLMAIPVSVVAASWFARHDGIAPTITYIVTIVIAIVANISDIIYG